MNNGAAQKAGIGGCHSAGMGVSDPTAVKKLISPEAELSDIDKPLKWISFLMVLYYHGVLLSVLANGAWSIRPSSYAVYWG